MKIVFFGSSEFSIPVLSSLLSTHNVVHVVTLPEKKKGRGQKLSGTLVKDFAVDHKLPCSEPERLSDQRWADQIKALKPDFIVVTSYGKLIPASIFSLPKIASLNVHPSLLPKYRGASPIQAAIFNGEKKTGISIAEVTKDLDTGDIFSQIETEILEDENSKQLSKRLSIIASKILLKLIDQFEKGAVTKSPQDSMQASYAKKIQKEDGQIDWNQSARQIHNQVRAYFPWPGAYTFFRSKRLKIIEAKISNAQVVPGKPGQMVDLSLNGIMVQAHPGYVELIKVQPEAGREMSSSEFARGQRLQKGEQLGS